MGRGVSQIVLRSFIALPQYFLSNCAGGLPRDIMIVLLGSPGLHPGMLSESWSARNWTKVSCMQNMCFNLKTLSHQCRGTLFLLASHGPHQLCAAFQPDESRHHTHHLHMWDEEAFWYLQKSWLSPQALSEIAESRKVAQMGNEYGLRAQRVNRDGKKFRKRQEEGPASAKRGQMN